MSESSLSQNEHASWCASHGLRECTCKPDFSQIARTAAEKIDRIASIRKGLRALTPIDIDKIAVNEAVVNEIAAIIESTLRDSDLYKSGVEKCFQVANRHTRDAHTHDHGAACVINIVEEIRSLLPKPENQDLGDEATVTPAGDK